MWGIQSSEKRLVRGLVKFVPALACLFCLALLGNCLVESAYLISGPCTSMYCMLFDPNSGFAFGITDAAPQHSRISSSEKKFAYRVALAITQSSLAHPSF